MIQFIKKNAKVMIISFIVGVIVSITVVYATGTFSSHDVSFDNTTANLTLNNNSVTNVQDAIDAVYTKLENTCPTGYELVSLGEHSVVCRNTSAPICKRATTLHTETCNQGTNNDSSYCYYDGYYVGGTKNTTTITYGRLGTSGNPPQVGDAFDCDVNGDGQYNATTERFYYVSDYFDTNTRTFDTTRAALIYYNHTVNGVTDDGGVEYFGTSSAYDNWHGPTTAITHLPSTTGTNAWRNDLLKTADRKILACSDNNCTTLSDATTGGIITYTTPIYNGKAARLIHLKEIKKGCATDLSVDTSLSNECNFLIENTKYTNIYKPTYGPWTENPYSTDGINVWDAAGNARRVYGGRTNNAIRGSRPVIDIRYSDILY